MRLVGYGGLCGDIPPHHTKQNAAQFSNLGHGGVSLAIHRRRATARSTLPSRRGAAALSTPPDVAASLLPVVAALVRAWIRVPTGSQSLMAKLASHGGDWPLPRGHYSTYRSPGVAGRVHGSITLALSARVLAVLVVSNICKV